MENTMKNVDDIKSTRNYKKIGIFIADSNGRYPVPASRGGAVSILVEHLVEANSKTKCANIEVVTYYDEEAERIADSYKNVNFIWIKPPRIIKALDIFLFNFIKKFFKKKKAISYKSLFSLIYYILHSRKYLKKNHYDKVVLQNNIVLAWIIRLTNYQGEYFYHFHNVPRINAKCKNVFDNCTGYLCVSQYVADQICCEQNPIGPIEKTKVKVLYNCIDTDLFKPIQDEEKIFRYREKYKIPSGYKIIVFAGRLCEEKGADVLLRAAKILKYRKVKILVVGSYIHNTDIKDEYQQRLYSMAQELGDKVIFTGYVPQSELPMVYNLADVAVLPSMWDEPAGLTMIEAMGCGVPVITTQSGGIPEYNGGYGVVLSRDDLLVKSIANNIDMILNNSELSSKMRKMGVQHVVTEFSTKHYLEEFIEKLEERSQEWH